MSETSRIRQTREACAFIDIQESFTKISGIKIQNERDGRKVVYFFGQRRKINDPNDTHSRFLIVDHRDTAKDTINTIIPKWMQARKQIGECLRGGKRVPREAEKELRLFNDELIRRLNETPAMISCSGSVFTLENSNGQNPDATFFVMAFFGKFSVSDGAYYKRWGNFGKDGHVVAILTRKKLLLKAGDERGIEADIIPPSSADN